jgi:hypothetical protein
MVDRKARKIDIEGCAEAPTIDGFNFFSGKYYLDDDDDARVSISGGVLPRDWEFFWRRHARGTPPGPLPEGALAVLRAVRSPSDPTAMEPEKIRLDNGTSQVSWKFNHTALPGETATGSYAILIVPGAKIEERITDVYLAEEKRKEAEALKVFTEGSQEQIKVRPAMKFKP